MSRFYFSLIPGTSCNTVISLLYLGASIFMHLMKSQFQWYVNSRPMTLQYIIIYKIALQWTFYFVDQLYKIPQKLVFNLYWWNYNNWIKFYTIVLNFILKNVNCFLIFFFFFAALNQRMTLTCSVRQWEEPHILCYFRWLCDRTVEAGMHQERHDQARR